MFTVSVHNIVWQMAILINNILYQETAVCAVCRCIDIESMIYMHRLHQTVWSGEMTIINIY